MRTIQSNQANLKAARHLTSSARHLTSSLLNHVTIASKTSAHHSKIKYNYNQIIKYITPLSKYKNRYRNSQTIIIDPIHFNLPVLLSSVVSSVTQTSLVV